MFETDYYKSRSTKNDTLLDLHSWNFYYETTYFSAYDLEGNAQLK